mmetsp:Transcript_12962/g.47392  ORF Transcript_12962/g.47392 Transcript_12962/m.47392 type:complete len:230 (+) Transcript_12962:2073-2762(+)
MLEYGRGEGDWVGKVVYNVGTYDQIVGIIRFKVCSRTVVPVHIQHFHLLHKDAAVAQVSTEVALHVLNQYVAQVCQHDPMRSLQWALDRGDAKTDESHSGAQLQDLRPLDELRSSFQPEQQGHRGRPDGVAKPSLPLLQLLKLYVLPVSPRYVSNVIITLLRGEYRRLRTAALTPQPEVPNVLALSGRKRQHPSHRRSMVQVFLSLLKRWLKHRPQARLLSMMEANELK